MTVADALAANQHAPAQGAPRGRHLGTVAAAASTSVRGTYEQWKQWADGARRSLIAGRPGGPRRRTKTIQAHLVLADEVATPENRATSRKREV